MVFMGSNSTCPDPSSLCLEGTSDCSVVAWKIVICDSGIWPRVQEGQVVKDAVAIVSQFKGAYVKKVEPRMFNFTRANQKLSYKITFTTKSRQAVPEFGGLVWKDGVHMSLHYMRLVDHPLQTTSD